MLRGGWKAAHLLCDGATWWTRGTRARLPRHSRARGTSNRGNTGAAAAMIMLVTLEIAAMHIRTFYVRARHSSKPLECISSRTPQKPLKRVLRRARFFRRGKLSRGGGITCPTVRQHPAIPGCSWHGGHAWSRGFAAQPRGTLEGIGHLCGSVFHPTGVPCPPHADWERSSGERPRSAQAWAAAKARRRPARKCLVNSAPRTQRTRQKWHLRSLPSKQRHLCQKSHLLPQSSIVCSSEEMGHLGTSLQR